MPVPLSDLLKTESKSSILARGLAIAQGLGLAVTSWVVGDPTRSLYLFLSEVLETLELVVAQFVAAGFLDYATGSWLTLLAKQVYNVDRVEATFASAPVRLTNAGGGHYPIEIGDVTVKCSATGKTYRNTTGGTLTSVGSPPVSATEGPAITLDFTADEPGAASTAGLGAIDALSTSMPGVTCASTLAALGLDQEADESVRERCRAKLGMLSPNGPRDAYDYVVRTPALTLDPTITRSRTVADSTTGSVLTYIASATGAAGLSGSAVANAQAAIEKYSTPLCMTPTAVACTDVVLAVTYHAWIYSSVGETDTTIKAKHAVDLAAMFAVRPIGGDVIDPATTGAIYQSLVEATIKASYPKHTFRVVVTLPADTALTAGQCAVLGVITGTVTFQVDP